VDNTLDLLSHWVTAEPDQKVNTPPVGAFRGELPARSTEGERTSSDGASAAAGSGTAGGDNSQPGEQSNGRDLAHAALKAAQERAKGRGHEPGRRKPSDRPAKQSSQNPRRRRWSAAGADERDPQSLGRIAARMATQMGWSDRLAGGHVFGRWATLVGEDVAEHAQPVSLTDGELVVRASSTAWATQLRLLQRQLLAKIAAGVGHGVVKRMRIQGPAAPSWRKGPRHVPGRGPRDTYG